MTADSSSDEFRRAWRPLLACAIGIGFGLTGLAYFSFGVFVVPISEAMGWTRGQTTLGSSFLLIGTAITAPIVGTLIDRFGARRVALISIFGVIGGYVALSRQNGAIAMFYATWLLMSISGGGTTPVVFTRTVNMWFDKGRGLALGLALAGSGFSGVFGPAICTALIRDYGWQGGYLGLSALTLVVAVPSLFLLFRERILPKAGAHESVSAHLPGLTLSEAVRTVHFWKIAGGFIMIAAVLAGLGINLVPLLRDRGLSAESAAQFAGIMGIAIVLGRIGVGFLVDRFRATVVARTLISLTAIGALLLTANGLPGWVPAISAAMFGFAAATEVDLVAYLSSRYLGMKAYGKIYGLQITFFYIGSATGPLAAGLAYDTFGGYREMLYADAALLVIGALIVGSLGKPPNFEEMPSH